MDYGHGRISSEIEDDRSKGGLMEMILRFINRDSPDSGSNILDQRRIPVPYDPNNGIARGPSEDIVGIPAQRAQLADQDALRVAPITSDVAPSVQQGRANEALLNQMMPQTPPVLPYPQEIPSIDALPPQMTPRLRGFQDIFQKIDPNQLDILKNIRGE